MMSDSALNKTMELDAALAAAVKPINVLKALKWPAETEAVFLERWRAGKPELPEVELAGQDCSKAVESLAVLAARCDRANPLENLIFKTAGSYASAGRMLGAIGTPAFTVHSIEIYGKPDDAYKTQDFTALGAAEFFMQTTDALLGSYAVPEVVADIPAGRFAERLQAEVDAFFGAGKVEVVLDPSMASKAIASSKRVRLRAGAMFAELDLEQLLVHEAQVHAGTMHNGKRQPFKVLALGAPRTTRTQEGIAVLSELMTLSLDIVRLRRVAQRVRAIALALDGADFIEVFRSFLETGQSEAESYQSAHRCFRGGDVRGKVAFTKDCVYLKGMMEVYTFLATCIHENRPELASALFAGRMTIADAIELAPFFESGVLVGPRFVPPWARDLRTLASAFACNAYFTRIDLAEVGLDNFVEYEEGAERVNLSAIK